MKTAYARFPAFDDRVSYEVDGINRGPCTVTLTEARCMLIQGKPLDGESRDDCDHRMQRGEPVAVRMPGGAIVRLHLLPNKREG